MTSIQAGFMVIHEWTTYGLSGKRMSLNPVQASGCSLTMYSYNKARQIKTSQDNYCAKVDAGDFEAVAGTPFPEDLQWEALVDVLRGRVKV